VNQIARGSHHHVVHREFRRLPLYSVGDDGNAVPSRSRAASRAGRDSQRHEAPMRSIVLNPWPLPVFAAREKTPEVIVVP